MHECRQCKIQHYTNDGRKVEVHTYTEPDGSQVVETLAEAARPMTLISRQTTATFGDVSGITPVAPPAPQGLTKQDVAEIVDEALNKLVETHEAVVVPDPPTVSAQSIVERNVAQRQKHDLTIITMVCILMAQVGYVIYWWLAK